ncbi:MAG: transcription termination factor NusA [Lentisphaeria bacterium]|nr:transcription termination factor NusA [Lentisphaeria bacterium]
MNSELLTIFEHIEQERGISREHMVRAIESALLTAGKRSIHPASQLKVKIDPQTGAIRAWAMLEVVASAPSPDQLVIDRALERIPSAKVGDVVEWEVTPRNFGRIAAQTAKQAIMQQLRKAEKEIVKEEFQNQVGKILNGSVRRIEGKNIVIDFQKAEGILPGHERISGEQYMVGEHINVLLLRIDTESSGPSLIVSRSHPDFLRALFEREVSEIHEGVVKIINIAREPGSRAKVAVSSDDSHIDPVGACVGLRGIRVKNITAELNGERLDIIPYNEDIKKYAANALQPAKVQSVDINEEKHELIVNVSADQSRLAFGKQAQNVRLSSKLLGWNINIRTEEGKIGESMEEKIRKAAAILAGELKISNSTAELLVNNGFVSPEGVKTAGFDQIAQIDAIDKNEIKTAFDNIDGAMEDK